MINKKSGYLFILTGILFLLSGIIDEQLSYYGVALMFIIIGIVSVYKSKSHVDNDKEP